MDKFLSRKTAAGLFFSRKRSGLVVRDSSTDRGPSTPICSRVGCSSRMNSVQDNRTSIDKPKATKRPLYPPRNGVEATASSSTTPASPVPRKSSDPSKKLSNACDRLSSRVQTNLSRESTSKETRSSVSVPCSRHGKEAIRRAELGIIRDSSTGSSSSIAAYKHVNCGSRSKTSSSKYNSNNLKCDVLNNADPSSASMSESSSSLVLSSSGLVVGWKRTTGSKRIGEVESSLPTRGKKISGMQLDERTNNDSHHGISISESRRRNDGVTYVRTSRSSTRARLNEQEYETRIPRTEASSLMPQLPQPGITLDTNASISEYLYPFQSTDLNCRLGNSSGNMPSYARQNNLNGIAEMLLAMDTIDQDDDLNYEQQQLVLETNLFLRGLSSHDQHRDMRLDIDHMSYEELLELEDRMGSVSKGLSEEALMMCLRKTIYESAVDGWVRTGDDTRCSICQEEYEEGNEVGRLLVCEHRYHAECIQRWLKLKNWCPICKSSAAAPSP